MSDLCVGYGCMNADDGIRLRSSSRKRRMSLAWQRNNGNFTLSSSSNVDVVVHWTSTTALEEIPEQSQSRRKTLQTCDVSPSYGDLPAAWWWIQKQGTLSVCVFFFDCSARAVPVQTSTSSKTTSKWFTLNCTLCVCSIIMQNERNKRTTKKKLFRSEETERRKKKTVLFDWRSNNASFWYTFWPVDSSAHCGELHNTYLDTYNAMQRRKNTRRSRITRNFY